MFTTFSLLPIAIIFSCLMICAPFSQPDRLSKIEVHSHVDSITYDIFQDNNRLINKLITTNDLRTNLSLSEPICGESEISNIRIKIGLHSVTLKENSQEVMISCFWNLKRLHIIVYKIANSAKNSLNVANMLPDCYYILIILPPDKNIPPPVPPSVPSPPSVSLATPLPFSPVQNVPIQQLVVSSLPSSGDILSISETNLKTQNNDVQRSQTSNQSQTLNSYIQGNGQDQIIKPNSTSSTKNLVLVLNIPAEVNNKKPEIVIRYFAVQPTMSKWKMMKIVGPYVFLLLIFKLTLTIIICLVVKKNKRLNNKLKYIQAKLKSKIPLLSSGFTTTTV
ncbi:hypothetical protein SNEBB_005313 [Seison nebaliae]|nr:hypothetical protein SNEBB_005313 [Seison nebaliae]